LILFNLVGVELLRLAKAAKRLGVHPMTLRQWAIDGKIQFEDFVSLVTTFAGRLYAMCSAQNRRRLLAESGQCTASGRVG
jgi:predicted site-specific integrase-resolvase